MSEYAHPDSQVSTDWVAEHLKETPNVRIARSSGATRKAAERLATTSRHAV